MPDVQVIRGYIPGSIGRVAELHATYYHQQWGFGLFFEAKIATELATFLGRYDEQRDGFWTASVGGRIEGSITIDGSHAAAEGAHLRWFIISDAYRGQSTGNQFMGTAIDFCPSHDYGRVYLWTFEGLQAARHLYEKNGFRLVEQRHGQSWAPILKAANSSIPAAVYPLCSPQLNEQSACGRHNLKAELDSGWWLGLPRGP
jgi:GNAT superfamily N-acetyltransferase